MTAEIKVEYSRTFREQLHERFYYLAKQVGPVAAEQKLSDFIADFESRLRIHPHSAPLCEEAADLGLTTYHDYIGAKLQLRAIYRYSAEHSTVYALLFLSTRQSIRQALVRHCLRQE